MDEIQRLKRQLAEIMTVSALNERTWRAAVVGLDCELEMIMRRHDGAPVDLGEYDAGKIVTDFRESTKIETSRNFIEICRAASHRLPDGWYMLDSKKHVEVLRVYVESLQTPLQRLRALRELLFPYFNFMSTSLVNTSKPGYDFTCILRLLFTTIHNDGNFTSQWFDEFRKHKNILSDNPAEEYLLGLIGGSTFEIDALLENFSIPADSWFIRSMLISLMNNLAEKDDEIFKRGLDHALSWMQQQPSLAKNVNAQIEALALALSRYANCSKPVEHPTLQKLSLRLVGNPWLDANKWAALVRNKDGRADEKARKMVDGWLKRTLISDFYSILQQENATDHKRLRYWLRFEKYIDDMWFVLDEPLFHSKQQRYVEFRERAYGRLSIIERGNGASAFIMRIGKYYFVEFSQTNNSCFVYEKDVLESIAGSEMFAGKSAMRVNMKALKDVKQSRLRLAHLGEWVRNFDDKFEQIIPRVMGQLPMA